MYEGQVGRARMQSLFHVIYTCCQFLPLFCHTHGQLNDWAMLILYARWQDITKWWSQIKRGSYGGRMQARWLSDTQNGQRQNPVQAHNSQYKIWKTTKQIQPLFQGFAIVKVEYTQNLLTFSRPNWMAIYNRNGPVQQIIFTGGAAKEKQKQPCKTQQTCEKYKTWGPFLRTNYRNVTSERSDMSLDRKILLPSFRD